MPPVTVNDRVAKTITDMRVLQSPLIGLENVGIELRLVFLNLVSNKCLTRLVVVIGG